MTAAPLFILANFRFDLPYQCATLASSASIACRSIIMIELRIARYPCISFRLPHT